MTRKSKRIHRGFAAKRQPDEKTPEVAPQTSSWRLFIVNVRLLKQFGAPVAVFIVIPGLLGQLGSALTGDATVISLDRDAAIGYFVRVFAAAWSFVGFAATYYYVLRVLGGNPAGILESYRRGARFIGRILLVNLCLILVVMAGLALFIVPGFVWLRRYFFAPYFLMDENMGVRDAMIASSTASRLVRRHVWSMFGILLAITAIAYGSLHVLPRYGFSLVTLIGALYVFLPALRYQEMSSDVRAGALAFSPPKNKN